MLANSALPIDELLETRWRRIVALLHLRPEGAETPPAAQAAKELSALGDLTGPSWTYECHQSVYPGRAGSMVPFSLLLLSAMVPAFNEEFGEAARRLYALLALLETSPWPRAARASAARESAASEQRRHVSLALVNVYCAHEEYPLAIALLESMLAAPRSDARSDASSPSSAAPSPSSAAPLLLNLLGRVHLQVGNLSAAVDSFERLECIVADAEASVDVRLNRSLLALARGEYEGALAHMDGTLRMEPQHATAASNRSVCLLYCCRFEQALRALEGFPKELARPPLFANLDVLYMMTDK